MKMENGEKMPSGDERMSFINRIKNNPAFMKSVMALSFLTVFDNVSAEKPEGGEEFKKNPKQSELYSDREKGLEINLEEKETLEAIAIIGNPKYKSELKQLIFNIEALKIKRDEVSSERELQFCNYHLKKYREELNSLLARSEISPDDQKQASEKLAELRQIVEEVKLEIKKHLSSEEYLQKLAREFGTDLAGAKIQQEIRLNNLSRLNCKFFSLEAINSESDFQIFSHYLSGTYNIYLPYNSDDLTYLRLASYHEILHETVLGEKHISPQAKKILRESYQTKSGRYSYFYDPAERLVRKQVLDQELERLGIKKYGEEFKDEHYHQLIKAYNNNQLNQDADRLLETTRPEFFKKLMNDIARKEEGQEEEDYA